MDWRATSSSLLVWGRSYLSASQLLPSPTPFGLPFQVMEIACGDDHCLYITATGLVYTQGLNSHGALGVQAPGNFFARQPVLVEGVSRALTGSCGPDHTLCVTEDGDIYSWGLGESGVLGLGDSRDRYAPVQVHLPPGHRAVSVTTGARHSGVICEKQRQKVLFMCGLNSVGQLGLGHTLSQALFTEVKSLDDVQQVACGFTHTLIVTRVSVLYCTGGNSLGQLGLGHSKSMSTPTRVPGLSQVVKAAAGSHSAALLRNGDLYVWGTGPFGSYSSPKQLNPAGITCTDMDLKSHFGLAKDQHEQLWTWGSNTSGQLGLGDYSNRSKLTKTAIQTTDLRLIRIGGASVLAVISENTEKNACEPRFSETQAGFATQSPTLNLTEGSNSTELELNRLKRTVQTLEKELISSYRDFSLRQKPPEIPLSASKTTNIVETPIEISDLEVALEEQMLLNDELTRNYAKLKVSHDAMEREMLDLAKELETRDRASDTLRVKYRKLKEAHVKLKLQNGHLLKNFKEEAGYKDRLKAELSSLESTLENTLKQHSEVAQLKEKLKTAERENAQLRQDLVAAQTKGQEAETKLITVLQENDSLKTDILRSVDWGKRNKPREETKKTVKGSYTLEPIEEMEGGSRPQSSGKRYSDVEQMGPELLDAVTFAPPLSMFPKEGDELELKSPDDSVQTLPPSSHSLRNSLSEITSKTKELKRSKTDAEMAKVLRERKRLLGRDSEGEEE